MVTTATKLKPITFVCVICTRCGKQYVDLDYGEGIDDCYEQCFTCDADNMVITEEQITDPHAYLIYVERELDNALQVGRSALPQQLFDKLLPLVDESKHVLLARAIACVFISAL